MAIRSTEPSVPSRRERAREHARRDILLAAAEVFSRRGYAAATLQELAEAAGFAAPSLYRYFGSKEEIFQSLLELLAEDFGATFTTPADPSLPLTVRLQALFAEQAKLATREHHRHMIALIRLPDASEALAALGKKLGSRHTGLAFYERHMAGWLHRHVKKGELRLPTPMAARAIAGLAFAFLGCPEDGAAPDPDLPRQLADLVLNGIAAPIDGRRGA
ncbi:MAG: helix-turn-helix domain-containing protein [Anaeromyxobacteraceae bacterium]